MSETGPDRALSIISLTTAIYFAVVFYLLGTGLRFHTKLSKIFVLISGALIGLFMCLTLFNQYKLSKKFVTEYDIRATLLQGKKVNNQTQLFELNKLPPSGMLYWEEISKDTSYFVNQHLKLGLNLPFSVKLKQ